MQKRNTVVESSDAADSCLAQM